MYSWYLSNARAGKYANAKTEQEKEQILRRYQEAVAQSDDIIARLYQTGELSQEEYDLLVTDYATKMLRGAQIGETKLPASFAYTSSIYGLNGLQEWSPLGLSRHQKLGQVYEEKWINELKQQNYPNTFIEQVGLGRNLVQDWLGAVPSEEDIKKTDNPLLFYIIRPSSKLPPSGSYDLFSKWLGGKAEYVTPEGIRITSYENPVNSKTANIIQKSRDVKGIPIGQDFRDNPKQKVNSASRGDIVRTPTSHPDDFTKKEKKLWKNKYTGEIWEKSRSKHSDNDGEWKVGINGEDPKKRRKITIGVNDGKIIKIDRK